MNAPAPLNADRSIRGHLLAGSAAAVLLVVGLGGWAYTTELSGAVIAAGLVIVDDNVKKVQHPAGGVVGEINVRDGDAVKAGDIVMRLDDTEVRANLAMITDMLDALSVKQARLEAERDGEAEIRFKAALLARGAEEELADLMRGERRLFESRRDVRLSLKAQLGQRIDQLREQIEGLELQVDAADDGLKLIQGELAGVEDLYRKKLVQITRVMQLKKEEAALRGDRGQFIAEVAQTKGRISETSLQILQIEQDLRSEVTKELRDVQDKTAELLERKVAATEQLSRIDIRAPHDGIVHQLAVHTIGGVVNSGEPLMLIVPEADELAIEVRIAAQDRDQVHLGQPVTLRMSSFNQSTTPELKGEVRLVAADLVDDQRTGLQYYPVRIALLPGESVRLGAGRKLMPGMPVESFVQTGFRTVFSYLTKPLSDYVTRAFRSE